ncbi:MAG TPA: nitrilase-related carbon-nitrogen hydrolase, partial [Candidatus Dormibacteraeota bacterium]|nr:nitrilase-related carbon-nitrogen hydrolase [Candidatus Dormibacteraeota bacterium]
MAAIQSTPVYVDGLATAAKAAESIAEAAQNGAWLAVFPETYIPGNPDFIDRAVPGSEVFQAFERR